MKLGCCVNMFASPEDPAGLQWLGLVKRSGCDYVELPLAQVMELDESAFRALCVKIWELELPCQCCNNFFPASVRLTGLGVDRGRIDSYAARAASRAARLGAEVIVFGSSGAKNVPEGFSRERAWEQIVEALELASWRCEENGLQIAIEPLSRPESNIVQNLREGMDLMRAVRRPNVRLLVDYYHFFQERELLAALREAAPYLLHAHFASPEGRGLPSALDERQRAFLGALKELGYDRRISLEAYSRAPDRELRHAVSLLQAATL